MANAAPPKTKISIRFRNPLKVLWRSFDSSDSFPFSFCGPFCFLIQSVMTILFLIEMSEMMAGTQHATARNMAFPKRSSFGLGTTNISLAAFCLKRENGPSVWEQVIPHNGLSPYGNFLGSDDIGLPLLSW